MRQKERDQLEAMCRTIASTHPYFQDRLQETTAEGAKSIEEELSDFLGAVWSDRQKTFESTEGKLQPLLLLFDLALLQVCDMSIFGLNNQDHRRRIIWKDLPLSRPPNPNAVFYILASNFAQSMQAFRLLMLHGFESQARSTFRSVVEIVDLMIVILASETTYLEYIKSFEDAGASSQHWRKHLSPRVVRALLSKIDATAPISIPVDMTPDEIRRDTYAWLSSFVHINFVAHIVSAHPPDWEGNSAPLAMLGTVGEMSEATLAHALMYLWISLERLDELLWDKHGWRHFRRSRSRDRFRYRSLVLSALFHSVLPTFWDQRRSPDGA